MSGLHRYIDKNEVIEAAVVMWEDMTLTSGDIINSTNNTNMSDNSDVASVSVLILVLKSAIMTAIMSAAVLGNLLVIISVIKFERLRGSITNYFIVSLAFADLLVAILVMPFNASQEISGKWVFGRIMCDIFNSNDVLFSTASILHLCCISVDRYIAIIHPLKYEAKMTRFRACGMLVATWIASILISYIPIHTQLYTTKEHYIVLKENHGSCTFQVNKIYAVISSSVSFWIPCTIMIFAYIKIFFTARRQEKHIRSASICSYDSNGQSFLSNGKSSGEFSERRKMKREHKAAKTLGIIMGVFIMCYLSFFSWYLTTTLCGDACPYPPILGSILFWIGYFNSCVNPIIYAYYNREFRSAFKRLLRIRKYKHKNRSSTTLSTSVRTSSGIKKHGLVQLIYMHNGNQGTSVI